MNKSFTAFTGEALAIGDRVIPIYWGGPVGQAQCGCTATVVGFGRKLVRIRYDFMAYGGNFPEFDTAEPSWLRVMEKAA